jgi:aconitate hydratase
MKDSFGSHATLTVGDREYRIARLEALEKQGLPVSRLPYALRILLENLLRREDGSAVCAEEIEILARWDAAKPPLREIAFMPARVLLQDFTGVPAVVDLAAMRDAMVSMGGDPTRINPLQPVELVIDHSVQVDEYGSAAAFLLNVGKEYERNHERYAFLRWGQQAFANFQVVPPGTGIVHQVNLEYLARVVMDEPFAGARWAFPDTLVGTDSHTTMVNGLGVLGWGVGGIEAEAAMLGQPVSMLIPRVIGFRLTGKLREGATATDLVLHVTQQLRSFGVVGDFVEFFGSGLAGLPLADRATIGNMAPEYGATCGIFPVDQAALDYLRFSSRTPDRIALVEAYMKEQGLFHTPESPEPAYSTVLELNLETVEPSLAGPRRPQDRVALTAVKAGFAQELDSLASAARKKAGAVAVETVPEVTTSLNGQELTLRHGSVVIAAITSCTNTSNPSVMVGAGLVAKKAVEKGLTSQPWVKTSLAPGSKVVTEYLNEAGLTPYLDQLGFNLVGYGCTTCIGNSGPLPAPISKAIDDGALVAVAVLSGNRNFEGRINQDVRANYLASPPLVVAYALAGRIDIDFQSEPLGTGKDGQPVYLRDLWPSRMEIEETIQRALHAEMFRRQYSDVFAGDERWASMDVPTGDTYTWAEDSTYVRLPLYFADMPREPRAVADIHGARVLGVFGDSITTDHISPAGAIKVASPAGKYLIEHGVAAQDFNSYGARRGNHEVMMRGTFANVRIRNHMVPEIEGGYTLHLPSGSSRDWAAKGPRLLGVRAVIAESFERIHRSNLVGMGIAPLEFVNGENAPGLGLTGREVFDIAGLAEGIANRFAEGREVVVRATAEDGTVKAFRARVRLDTPQEMQYYRHGGILHYVLRQLLA